MSKTDKTLSKMRSNPRDWRIEQLKSLADAHGIAYRQPGTSHVTFRFPNGAKLTVPAHRPIAPEYVKAFVQELDRLTPQEDGDCDDDE
jgi:hypothetical protein